MGKRQGEGCEFNASTKCCAGPEHCPRSEHGQSAAGTAAIEAFRSIRESNSTADRTASKCEPNNDKPDFGDVNKDLGKFVKRGWWSR